MAEKSMNSRQDYPPIGARVRLTHYTGGASRRRSTEPDLSIIGKVVESPFNGFHHLVVNAPEGVEWSHTDRVEVVADSVQVVTPRQATLSQTYARCYWTVDQAAAEYLTLEHEGQRRLMAERHAAEEAAIDADHAAWVRSLNDPTLTYAIERAEREKAEAVVALDRATRDLKVMLAVRDERAAAVTA